MIFIYRFITFFFYPILIILIFFRKILKKEDSIRYKEKIFSSYFSPRIDSKKKLIWFHAASIGEVQSILPLIYKMKEDEKNLEFLITTVTLSAGNLIEKKIVQHHYIKHRYFPLDVKFLMKIFLEKWKPGLIIFVDSEIWPNLLMEIKKKKIPLAIVNGRITKKTFKRWMMISSFAKKIFNIFDLCLASSNESKKYLEQLNARSPKYIGNIKLAGIIDKTNIRNINKNILSEKKFWCAASTHKGEEIFCLKTHLNLKKNYKDIITIIIPRHIDRSMEIKRLCNKMNLSAQILSDEEVITKGKEIIIVNSFGVLHEYFKYSKSVFIGKSLIKKLQKVGGQNPIEAGKLGCKIYHGPYVYNFKEIYDLFKIYKIAEEVSDENELSKKLAIDLSRTKKNQNEITEKINYLGNKILNSSYEEIKKI
ncbi:MAG: hypothetical protein CBD13_001570 [Candidatus Pelagibacter sp. TMED153]|nr:MAG: hypothetical protein CBD13_001570 [Candidatus Pelagibacter sp. TMED153]